MGFYRWWQKHFSRRKTTVIFFIYKFETKKKIFSNFKIRGSSSRPPGSPFKQPWKRGYYIHARQTTLDPQ